MTMGSLELYRLVQAAQRQITTQIPIEFCILVMGLSLSLGHCQCYKTITFVKFLLPYFLKLSIVCKKTTWIPKHEAISKLFT